MSKTPNSVFQKFLQDIEPSATTKAAAKSAHEGIRKVLHSDGRLKDLILKTLLSGSYRRDTAIRPRIIDGKVQRPDVDVIALLSLSLSEDPKAVLQLIYAVLNDNYDSVRLQARSVRVETSAAIVDVVPLAAPQGEDGPLYIPDRRLESWVETNPPRHTSWTEQTNKTYGKRFKPLVKLTKWWRRERPTGFKGCVKRFYGCPCVWHFPTRRRAECKQDSSGLIEL